MPRSSSEGQALVRGLGAPFRRPEAVAGRPRRRSGALAALADWVVGAGRRQPGAAAACRRRSSRPAVRLAAARVALDGQRQALEAERSALEDERGRLEAGIDTAPPPPYTRDADVRERPRGRAALAIGGFSRRGRRRRSAPGSKPRSKPPACSTPGSRPTAGCRPATAARCCTTRRCWTRPPHPPSLADWLQADVPADSAVPAGIVERAAVRHRLRRRRSRPTAKPGSPRTAAFASARWPAPGRKPAAVYIGHAARAAARARRLAEIAARLAQLADELAAVQARPSNSRAIRIRPPRNGALRPSDEALRKRPSGGGRQRARSADSPAQRWREADRQLPRGRAGAAGGAAAARRRCRRSAPAAAAAELPARRDGARAAITMRKPGSRRPRRSCAWRCPTCSGSAPARARRATI